MLIAGCITISAMWSTGCTSSRAYQQAIEDRDGEIRKLREERASLKGQVQDLKAGLDSAQADMVDASATRPAATEPEPSRFPELDNLGIGYGMRDGNMVISIPSSISFASGQATLSKEGQQALKQVASTLKQQYPGARYTVQGHTDSDPIKKSKFSSNRELSIQRAMAVLTFLVTECGVKDDQCIVSGHGQYEPVAPNEGKDKSRNRRVEIVVHKG
jgi:chemotaxis protein MotB